MKITLTITNLNITIETDDSAPGTSGLLQAISSLSPVAAAQTVVTPAPAVTPIAEEPPPVAPTGHTLNSQPRATADDLPEVPRPVTPDQPLATHRPLTPAQQDGLATVKSRQLPFSEFDRLVRAEMKRLAPTPGVMPGHKLWDSQRHMPLPTLQAVIARYGHKSAPKLARQLGLEPHLGSNIRTLSRNGEAQHA